MAVAHGPSVPCSPVVMGLLSWSTHWLVPNPSEYLAKCCLCLESELSATYRLSKMDPPALGDSLIPGVARLCNVSDKKLKFLKM